MKILLLAFIGLTTASNASAEVHTQQAIKVLISELQDANFTNITVTERILGGVVVEAEHENNAVLITLAPETNTVSYVEAFSEATETGFFGAAQRPITPQIENVLAGYQSRLQGLDSADEIPDTTTYLTDSANHERTAGFLQSRSIISEGDAISIKRSETLGLLDGFTTTTQASEFTETRSTGKATFQYSMSKSVVTQSVQMIGIEGFSEDVFADTQGFTHLLIEKSTVQLPSNPTLRSDIINQIANNTENNVSDGLNNQALTQESIRSLIEQNLQNQLE